jgi:hypothetical protein
MKYLCLIYSDEAIWPSLPKSEEEKMMAEYRAFGESVKASGQLLAAHRLHNVDSATTIRVRNGKMSTTDGPFAETKEQLGGFYLIEAKDLNDAISVGSRIPGAKYGSIEVRPVWEMSASAG